MPRALSNRANFKIDHLVLFMGLMKEGYAGCGRDPMGCSPHRLTQLRQFEMQEIGEGADGFAAEIEPTTGGLE